MERDGHPIFFLGIVGAAFANMTGTGGGIVFFPAFVALGLTPTQAAATSMLIQSFGMTSGSVSWTRYFHQYPTERILMLATALLALCFSLLGVFVYVMFIKHPSINIELIFRIISVLIAISLIIHYFKYDKYLDLTKLASKDMTLISIVAFIGGIITAVTSIGIGELLAATLMMRRFRADLAIASACIVSAGTVIALTPHFVFVPDGANLTIAAWAVPGAIIGGYAARFIAKVISVKKLKLIFIGWILISSVL